MTDDNLLVKSALRTIRIEQQAILELAAKIDDAFVSACRLMLACQGRVVVT